MRVYVPAAPEDLRRLEAEGSLPHDVVVAYAVTPWVMSELDVDDPEDEAAEHAVLTAAAQRRTEQARDQAGEEAVGDAAPAAVAVFDLPVAALPAVGMQVSLAHALPRRRLVAIHLCPGLEWYAGQELPDVVAALAGG